jgi:hypothetical protein
MRRPVLLMVVAVLAVPLFAVADAGAKGARARATAMRLQPFKSCDRLTKYGRRHARRELGAGGSGVVAPGTPPPTTGPPAPTSTDNAAPEAAPGTAGDSSGTNVQEQGVDEPDIVKSDGTHIFALVGGHLNAIDARAGTPELLGSLDFGSYGGELLLYGKRALIISYAPQVYPTQGGGGSEPGASAPVAPDIAYYRPATLVTEVDVSDPAAMRIVKTETIEGLYVSARLNGASARIVLTSSPAALDDGGGALRTKARGWLPRATLENKATGAKRTRRLTSCRAVKRPRVFSGLDTLTVLTIDMRRGLPAVDADAIVTDGQTVYASNDSLYVATQRFVAPPGSADRRPPPLTTAIHRFDIQDAGRARYRASGEVTGYVLNQFALSEYKGVLRVASTDSPGWWPGADQPDTQSYVTTLKQSGGALLRLGRVGSLGRGEQIQGVRFDDDSGFVVTFRQTDPLYTVDLSKPNEPRVAGELKLLGWSAYLHPIAGGLLLGVGQDATEEGRRLGTQVSLFDVSDLGHPQRLSRRRIGSSSSSEVEYDHHAFLYWAPTKLAVVPVTIYDGGSNPFLGAVGFRVGRTRIDEVGRIAHDSTQQYQFAVRRSVVVGDRLFTISDAGAESSDLGSFADEAWVPFPEPQYSYGYGTDGGAPQAAGG